MSELPEIGDVIAEKYRIVGSLGEGGMAVVFAAHHQLLDKPVAVKILSPSLPRTTVLIERFLTEARAAARVDSPHVARVVDVGTLANGLPYMVMERLEGCDLGELLTIEKRLPIGDAVDYTLQALQGLAHAHMLGVVHRDLKPANLFLAHQADGTAIIKVLDFGIAKVTTAGRLTDQNQALGSPSYMSPEHIRNEPIVDHRTDVWAMGIVLYELLTGHTPFEAEGVGETLGAVLDRKAEPPSKLRPEIPAELDAAIMRCLEKDPVERFPDVAQLSRAIGPFGTGACVALVEATELTLRQELRRYSGTAMLIRPTPIAAMKIEAIEDREAKRNGLSLSRGFGGAAPITTESAALAATVQDVSAQTTQEAPVFVRPRRRGWLYALAAAGALVVGYGGLVMAGISPLKRSASVAAPEASSAPIDSSSASNMVSAPTVKGRGTPAPSHKAAQPHPSNAVANKSRTHS